ncbi:NADH:flavin oxidoreductase [Synergistales bacterium]|nr:NADH:flavin oxidoreductase [Synergistales bacterium]
MTSALFSPLMVGNIVIANRILAEPMATQSFDEDGVPTGKTMEIYMNYASSGVGIAITEHHAVHPWGRNRINQPRLYDKESASYLLQVTDLFRRKHIPVIAQLNFAGSMTADEELLQAKHFEYVSPSGKHSPRDVIAVSPRALTKAEIDIIIESFANAAYRAVNFAGYDGVQIHCAHGYLLGQFLSPMTNRRNDTYGGILRNRARMLYDVVSEVRKAIPGKLLSVRLGMVDQMPGEPTKGLTVDDTARVAKGLAALGVNWIGLSGNHSGFGADRNDDCPYFAQPAEVVHEAIDGEILIDYAGGVRSKKTALDLLEKNVCEIVGIGRLFSRDPNFISKWREAD